MSHPPPVDYATPATPVPHGWPTVAALFTAVVATFSSLLFVVELLHNSLSPLWPVWAVSVVVTAVLLWVGWGAGRTVVWIRRTNRAAATLAVLAAVLGVLQVANSTTFFGTDPHVIGRRINGCDRRLSVLGQIVTLYAMEHNRRYPDTLDDLIGYLGMTSADFRPPLDRTRRATPPAAPYVYVGKGLTYPAGLDVVVAYEPPSNHAVDGKMMHVLFGDGRTELIRGDAVDRVMKQLEGATGAVVIGARDRQ
jgi:hypothetical protein